MYCSGCGFISFSYIAALVSAAMYTLILAYLLFDLTRLLKAVRQSSGGGKRVRRKKNANREHIRRISD